MDLEVWQGLESLARSQGTTASAVLREYAERYVRRGGKG